MANSKKAIASQASIKRAGIFKDAAIDTIKDSTAYDSMLMESNEEYMERLTKSDKEEYDILKLNMQMAESESERAAIRQAMADMRKDRVIKDTENKAFYEKQQKEHNENRGGDVYKYAIQALEICKEYNIESGIIMCAMNWNFTKYRNRN